MKKNLYPITCCFIALWMATTISMLFSIDIYPRQSENRSWAAWPATEVLLQKPQAYTQAINNYAADYFGLRTSFIRLHNWLKFAIFHTSPNELVMLGKHGWLFWIGQDSLPFYRNAIPFTDEEFNRLNDIFEKTQTWMSKRHIDFLISIPPDPPNVFPHALPNWVKVESGQPRRQQITEAANRYMRYPILDLVPVLQEADKKLPAYHRTDSHWNEWGAFTAVDLLMRQLKKQHPDLHWQPENYHFNAIPTQGIDLARAIGLPDLFSDFAYKQPEDKYIKTDTRDVHNYTTICASCQDKTLLVVLDSYGLGMMPFLSSTFRKVVYVWENTVPFKRIEEEKPDIVLFELVERKLSGLPPYEVPQ